MAPPVRDIIGATSQSELRAVRKRRTNKLSGTYITDKPQQSKQIFLCRLNRLLPCFFPQEIHCIQCMSNIEGRSVSRAEAEATFFRPTCYKRDPLTEEKHIVNIQQQCSQSTSANRLKCNRLISFAVSN